MIDQGPTPDLERRGRAVSSWTSGRHLPEPYFDGYRWRCSDCGLLLTRYTTDLGYIRLRHHPRGAS